MHHAETSSQLAARAPQAEGFVQIARSFADAMLERDVQTSQAKPSCCFLQKESTLAWIRGAGRKIFVYVADGARLSFVACLDAHRAPISSISASDDGRLLCSAASDQVVLWAPSLERGPRRPKSRDSDVEAALDASESESDPPPRPFQPPSKLRFYMRYKTSPQGDPESRRPSPRHSHVRVLAAVANAPARSRRLDDDDVQTRPR